MSGTTLIFSFLFAIIHSFCSIQVLEKGPNTFQQAVLLILHCMVHYVDLNTTPTSVLNKELFNTVAKHVQGSHWKEAIKILKLTVARSSTLTAAPPSSSSSLESAYSGHSVISFSDVDISHKKELPGKTVEHMLYTVKFLNFRTQETLL